jgi:hypothetical protein
MSKMFNTLFALPQHHQVYTPLGGDDVVQAGNCKGTCKHGYAESHDPGSLHATSVRFNFSSAGLFHAQKQPRAAGRTCTKRRE